MPPNTWDQADRPAWKYPTLSGKRIGPPQISATRTVRNTTPRIAPQKGTRCATLFPAEVYNGAAMPTRRQRLQKPVLPASAYVGKTFAAIVSTVADLIALHASRA